MRRRDFIHGGLTTGASTIAALSAPGLGQAQQPPRQPNEALTVDPAGRYKKPNHDVRLPDGILARGSRNVRAAWLSEPTNRYRHFVLGSQQEAGTLMIATAENRNLRLTLPNDSVFEDRTPRIADVDGDGLDEIVVVKSYLKRGSTLAIAAVRSGEGLKIVAETPPIGEPFRWLNPAGIADFDGDGKPEIALVRMPHALGELELWAFRGGQLDKLLDLPDVSNHVAGSKFQNLFAVADFDGDGIVELAIPSFDRRSLRFLSFKGGTARELDRFDLPAPATEDFKVGVRNGRPVVLVGLSAGRTHTVGL